MCACVIHASLCVQIGELYEEKAVSDDLFALACEPDKRVRVYSACIVDAVRYHTIAREKNRNTQNSGISTEGPDGEEEYGQLTSIIRLQYNSSTGIDRSVVLFQCDWFDIGGSKTIDDGHFTSINTARFRSKNDPYILTTQATKVFYLPDTRLKGHWRVVQLFQHRNLWCVTEKDAENGRGGSGLSYQDDNSRQVPVQEGDLVQTRLRKENGSERLLVGASVREQMLRTRQEVDGDESEDDEDETMDQYCSDGEPEDNGQQRRRTDINDDE